MIFSVKYCGRKKDKFDFQKKKLTKVKRLVLVKTAAPQ